MVGFKFAEILNLNFNCLLHLQLRYLEELCVTNTVIDPFRQRSNRGIILNAVFNNSAQEGINTFSTQSG